MGNKMDLNFNPIETGSLALAIIATAFTLQDGTSNYMKGFILLLCYVVIGACFFLRRTPFRLKTRHLWPKDKATEASPRVCAQPKTNSSSSQYTQTKPSVRSITTYPKL
ncbi:hypothetical protein K1719_006461 [Acacia pycnantha]|nr:hypothetical protein K1719_006461 [Acacia pycnantha]